MLTACAPKAPALPTGAGEPFGGFAAAYDAATSSCRDIKTITVSMSLSGKAGSTKLHGRIDAGFAAPARARLEGIAPFGRPAFILVADEAHGTLVLPRDDRVLRDAPADRIVEALAGVALDTASLRTIVSGCGLSAEEPVVAEARAFGSDWVSAPQSTGAVYLRRSGDQWNVAAATRGPLTVTYSDFANGRPSTIHLRATSDGRTTADLTVRLSDVDVNVTLDPRTFQVELPEHAVPLTLEELRKSGPLGRQGNL
jgi:outer membrane lipoprotein-sorting protein